MIELRQTAEFSEWMQRLRDRQAAKRIAMRLDRLAYGLTGDAKPVGEGVMELRIDHGPGYRVYYIQRGTVLVVLLHGGDKGSQKRDIGKAQQIARQL